MFLFNKKIVKPCFIFVAISILFIGCSPKAVIDQTSRTESTSTNNYYNSTELKDFENKDEKIKVDGIYKMKVIGEVPQSIGLSSVDRKNVHANIGAICNHGNNKYSFLGRLFYSSDSISAFALGGNTSIFDNTILSNYDARNSPDEVDIDKLAVIFYEESSIETTPYVIAYSKLVDSNDKVNNIGQIKFEGFISKNDIIADIVAVIKTGDKYKLVSNSMKYDVIGELPEELKNSAILQSNDEFPTVVLNHAFVVYMSIYEQNKANNTFFVKVITYSPFLIGSILN